MEVICPLCAEGMILNAKGFYKCYSCAAELWPENDSPKAIRATWNQQIAEGRYGNPKSGGGNKGGAKKKVASRRWYEFQ